MRDLTERLRRAWSDPRIAVPILVVCVVAACLGVRATGLLVGLELMAYDQALERVARPDVPDPRVLIIGITEEDIQRYGAPLPDSELARALALLGEHGARAIGVDVFRDLEVGEGSAELHAVLDANPRIVGIRLFPQTRVDKGVPCPEVLEGDRCAFNDLRVDPDNVVRRGLLYLSLGTEQVVSLPLALTLAAGLRESPDPDDPRLVRLLPPEGDEVGPATAGAAWPPGNGRSEARDPRTIPWLRPNDGGYVGVDDRGYPFLLDYRGAPLGFAQFSLSQLLDGDVGSSSVENRIVLIGYTAVSAGDTHAVPIQGDLEESRIVFGVEVHAHIVSQLLRLAYGESEPVRTLGETGEAVWILLWTIAGAAVGLALRSVWLLAAAVGLALAVWGTGIAAIYWAWWLPTVPAAGAALGCSLLVALVSSARERAARELLDGIVGKSLLETVIEDPGDFIDRDGTIKMKTLPVTTLFVDMRGYTSAAQQMEPAALMEWINEFMSRMTSIILDAGGMLDDYAGDGIKAVFGVPRQSRSVREYAIAAVDAALEMYPACLSLLGKWEIDSQVVAEGMRIGINTGEAVAGAVGNRQRFKYTVVGTSVNTAARLESFSQVEHDFSSRPCRILIGSPTKELVEDVFVTRHLGAYELKGLSEKVDIHEVTRRRRPNRPSPAEDGA